MCLKLPLAYKYQEEVLGNHIKEKNELQAKKN